MTDESTDEKLALDAIEAMLEREYATGIAFISRHDNTIAVDWINDTTTEYTLEVRTFKPQPYRAVRDA